MVDRFSTVPHAVRLVLFPRPGDEMCGWQFTELHYLHGYPAVGYAEGGSMFMGTSMTEPLHRVEALYLAAQVLRSGT